MAAMAEAAYGEAAQHCERAEVRRRASLFLGLRAFSLMILEEKP